MKSLKKDKLSEKSVKKVKSIVEQAIEEITLEQEIQRNQAINLNLDNSIVRMIGDRNTLISIIKLLAFIRHAINLHQPTEIKIKLNNRIADGKFMFDVNQQEIQDLITQNEIEID